MAGADVGVYLVHSMLPSSRLTQGRFADLDLIMADNFARAAREHGLRQIIYISGLIPDDEHLSPHLESRLEVERTLESSGVPVTSLRAGMIVGPGGSSLDILVTLVRRLPGMLLPRWTTARTQPIALQDVVRAVTACLDCDVAKGKHYDIGGPDIMSYRDMIERTAETMGRSRTLIDVPWIPSHVSRLWVSFITGAPSALTGPLIESLRHEMLVTSNPLQRHLEPDLCSFDDALRSSLDAEGRLKPNPRVSVRRSDDRLIRKTSVARSVQRFALPPVHRASWVAEEYMRWLPRFVWPLMRVQIKDRVCLFQVAFLAITLLELTHERDESDVDCQFFTVTGGLLARVPDDRHGRLEFREVLDRSAIIAAVHDFSPRLPWYVYNLSQALVHLWVMWGFGRHLARVARGDVVRGPDDDPIAECAIHTPVVPPSEGQRVGRAEVEYDAPQQG